MIRKSAFIAAAFVAAAASSIAIRAADRDATPGARAVQPGSITGRVQNVATGQFLPNARVTVRGTDRVAFTDESGTYRLADLPSGPVVLEVFYTGLDPHQSAVDVPAGRSATHDVQLTNVARYGSDPGVVKLDSFVVSTSPQTEGDSLAINEQRFAANIKNVVPTDSFGDMAEGNVGEFLKFLPGVTGDYDDSQINTVSLRGFATNLTVVSADGAQLANANFNGSSRTFQFSQLAINNVSRIEVTKVPTPSTPADSMSGSLNMVSKSAFERSRAQFRYRAYIAGNGDNLTLRRRPHSYEERRYKILPGFDFDTTLPVNRNFGIVVTGNMSDSAGEEDHSTLTYNAAGTATGASVTRPFFQQYGVNDGSKDIHRESLSVKADWRVTPNSVLSLGLMANRYEAFWGHQSLDVSAGTNGTPTIAASAGGIPLTFSERSTSGATGRGAITLGSGNFMTRYEAVNSANLRYRFDNGAWRVETGLNRSASSNKFRSTDEGNFAALGVTFATPVRIVFDDINAIRPNIIQAFDNSGREMDIYDVNNYRLNTATAMSRDVSDDILGGDLNIRHRLAFLPVPASLQVGGLQRVQERDHRRTSPVRTYNGVDGDFSAARFKNEVYSDRNSYFGTRVPPWISKHRAWQAYQENPGLFTMTPAQTVTAEQFRITNSEHIREKASAFYAQAEARLFKNRLNLLTGVRYERTTDAGQGPVYEPGAVFARNPNGTFMRDARGQRIRLAEAGAVGSMEELRLTRRERASEASRSYHGYYPSLHVTYSITDNFQARLAYAKTYGRPDFNEVIPNSVINERDLDESQSLDPSVIRGTIDIRNTGLRPWTADNYDLSLEYYTDQGGVISAGLFVKDIANFFASDVRIATAEDLDALGIDRQYVGWQLSTKYNSGNARVTGAEFNLRHSLQPLGGWGRHFTVFLNATKLKLEGSRQADFAGFIPENVNWGVTFSRKPVTIVTKWNYRGEQKGAAFAQFGPDAFNHTKARLTLDLSVDYQMWKNLALTANARNVTNEYISNLRYGSQTPDYAKPRQHREYGVYFSLGVKGTF
ncbi:MAG: TonB-dependent receptor [Opitutaceae bacterium]|nr:TonB-dependent receptor [Opitutaceae bacterium]